MDHVVLFGGISEGETSHAYLRKQVRLKPFAPEVVAVVVPVAVKTGIIHISRNAFVGIIFTYHAI